MCFKYRHSAITRSAAIILIAVISVFTVACGGKNEDNKTQQKTGSEISRTVSSDSADSGELREDSRSDTSSESPVSDKSIVNSHPDTVSTLPASSVSRTDSKPTAADGNKNFSAETLNYLNTLSNKREGYGWLNAEKRQDYYAKYNAYAVGDQGKKSVYLTFDEGYEYKFTPRILDILKEKNVKAVFFVTMGYVKANPSLVRRMIDEGHTVGNHTLNHPDMTQVSPDTAYNEIKVLHDYMEENFGYRMSLFRFPTGANSTRMLALVSCMGYKSVFWNFAHKDWDPQDQPDCSAAAENILKYTKPGTIYLLHAVSQTNTEILADVIDRIRAEGYSIELFG